MSIFKRILLLFCVLAILLFSLSSCMGALLLSGSLLPQRQNGAQPNIPSEEKFAYTLTEADRQTVLADLNDLEKLILEERSSSETKINAACDKMEDSYYHIATQTELAYIYHCLDKADTEKSQAYLYASAMQSDLYAAYQTTCKRIDASDAPGKSIFFADWSEEDLEEMRGYSEEYTELVQANDRLVVEYRSLSKTERKTRAPELYLQIVRNNNRIAALYGYESYPAYAYAKIYHRDYTPADAEQIHVAVKSILLPACQTALQKFQSGYSGLTAKEREIVRALLEGEYNDAWSLLGGYLASYSDEVEEDMRSLFLPDNHFLTDAQNADAGAFTTYLYDYEQPVCYFGPGYHDGFTVIHELGHYYSALFSENKVQMDIAETQSQANEWLFTAYLQNTQNNQNIAQTVLYYQLHSAIQTIVLASIIDEFEKSVYLDPPASPEELDARMRAVCQGYGGVDAVKAQFADPMQYWRAVTLENPCYYISYSFSMLAAINFYELATREYPAAQSVYLDLAVLELEDGKTYLQWLEEQKMHTPFEEEYYQIIAALVE